MKRGKLIAIYGVNGIGKTTQVELLVEFLRSKGKNASRLKYPIYDLEPEGPFLYKYLRDSKFRKKNELTTDELQKKYVDNRKRYQKKLIKRLEKGEWIVAEDYVGTGIAWGLTWGGNFEYLEKINRNLVVPDFCILMHGERFLTAVEKDHRNEVDAERITLSRNFHMLLAHKNGWSIVNANRKKEKVRRDMGKLIEQIL